MTADTVLLVTASYDVAADYVDSALERCAAPRFRLDTDRFPSEVRISFSQNGDMAISDGHRSISSRDVRSVWYRRNVSPDLPLELPSGVQDFCERETRAFLEGVLLALPTQRWLSSPSAIWNAEHKPYQLATASRLGFAVPDTTIANDESMVRQFASGRTVVAKAVSAGYIVEPNGGRAIFTSAVHSDDLLDLSGLKLAPVIFQQRIEKVSDIRVTVVGDDVFSTEILSQERASSEVDWRATDDPGLEHRNHELPPSVTALCRKLLTQMGLDFGAIDLALCSDGTYVFFEINPNGEWLWLEDIVGLPISDSIARWLCA